MNHASLHVVKNTGLLALYWYHHTAASVGIEYNSEYVCETWQDRSGNTSACASKDAASDGSTSRIHQGDDTAIQEHETVRICINNVGGVYYTRITWLVTTHRATIYATDNKTDAFGYPEWRARCETITYLLFCRNRNSCHSAFFLAGVNNNVGQDKCKEGRNEEYFFHV